MDFVLEKHGGVIIQAEDNTPMKDDDHVLEYTIEDDGTNALIHDTFGTGVVATTDDDDEHDIDAIHDTPLLEKENMILYKGSQSILLSIVFLLVNLKVMNGLSNITRSRILRFVRYVIIIYKR